MERKYRLGGTCVKQTSILNRLHEIMGNLASLKVQDRAGVNRNFDMCIFRLFRMLIIWTVTFCQFAFDQREFSLLDEEEKLRLVDEARKLTHSLEWPVEIKAILKSVIACLEKLIPNSVQRAV
jgi:hypothetical protein